MRQRLVLRLSNVLVRKIQHGSNYQDQADDHGNKTMLIVFQVTHLSE
jgi:hypothetical protein